MLKIISAAASGLVLAGTVGYSYVQKAQQHVADLESANKTLTATVNREDSAIDKAIADLQSARSAPVGAGEPQPGRGSP
jgi:outer membrane murein-binding lipoprotein Lpp